MSILFLPALSNVGCFGRPGCRFGSPRVGNAAFASKLNSKVKHHFRIVNDGDLVTALPRFFGTYKHAGEDDTWI